MRCKGCNKPMKHATPSGMGRICEAKARRNDAIDRQIKMRVEPLFIRFQPRRSYLVWSKPRQIVVINDRDGKSFAVCQCDAKSYCDHIAVVADIDKEYRTKTQQTILTA